MSGQASRPPTYPPQHIARILDEARIDSPEKTTGGRNMVDEDVLRTLVGGAPPPQLGELLNTDARKKQLSFKLGSVQSLFWIQKPVSL